VGKPRKSKDERARDDAQRARIRAAAAESRGRRVGPTVAEYEVAALRGHRRVAEALISRHNVRMKNIPKTYDDVRYSAMSALIPIVQLDIALKALGMDPGRHPSQYVGPVVDRLAWGVDSAVSAVRLLLSGQALGAAAVVRNQLERWMSHRAASLRLVRGKGESMLDFIARVWSRPDELHDQWFDKHQDLVADLFGDLDESESIAEDLSGWSHAMSEGGGTAPGHLHVFRSDGTDVCPAMVFGYLSEILHLRAFDGVVNWDAELLLSDGRPRQDVALAAMVIGDAVFLVLREIRLLLLAMAKRRHLRSVVELLSSGMDSFSISETQTELPYEAIPFGSGRMRETFIPPIAALAPLVPGQGLSSASDRVLSDLSQDYEAVLRKERPAGRLYQDDELLVRSFAWHRQRNVRAAFKSLRWEQRVLGEEFDEEVLIGRSSGWVLLTEAASVLALWHPTPGVKSASSALASSLRSAYWLWLEDDDRAMAVLRSSLEYVARLRTWRRRPDKAQILDSRPRSTPRDWLTRAGWSRLHVLNRTLGEFSHADRMKNWPTARRTLSELQLNVHPDRALLTARGAAIDFVASLAVREIVQLLTGLSTRIGNAVGEIFQEFGHELDEGAPGVEAQFVHILSVRTRIPTV